MNNSFSDRGVAQLARASGSYPGGRGFDPLRRDLIWRITQVWLKGTVLKTVRWVKPRKSSNLLSSLFRRSIGVVVISSPCHGEDRRFKSVMDRYIVDITGSVAQSVEQWIEAPCVGGSIPSRAIH